MKFLKNIWYMASWGNDIQREPVFRKIVDEPIVLYRTQDGNVVALEDTCPHRFAPLHLGQIVDDTIQCPYHGLKYGPSGKCVFNPHGDGSIPNRAQVKKYPVVECDTIIWVWIGDPALQDPSLIRRFPVLNNDDNRYTITAGGLLTMNIPYDLLIDNLLDLSHAAFLHKKNLGSEAFGRGIVDVRVEGQNVYSDRLGENGLPAPVFVMTGACGPDDMVDYWVNVHWSPPANLFLDGGIVATGGSKEEDAKISSSVQILTPESESSTMYFIKIYRNYNRDDAALNEVLLQLVMAAFREEDEWMVQNVSERMAGREFWSMKPLSLQSDGGAVQVRRMMERLLKEQDDLTKETSGLALVP